MLKNVSYKILIIFELRVKKYLDKITIKKNREIME